MASQASGEENYQPIFYTFCVMRIFCSLLILNLNLSFKKPAKKVFKVMCNVNLSISFLLIPKLK